MVANERSRIAMIAVFVLFGLLTGCPNLDGCLPPELNDNTNDNGDNSNTNTNTNDNGNENDNLGVCHAEPRTTANPDARSGFLGGDAQRALLQQVETVSADVGLIDELRVTALDFSELRGVPFAIPIDGAYWIVGGGDTVAWVDSLYDIYAQDVGESAATLYYNAASMSITRIAAVSRAWIVFYVPGSDAIQVIDRGDGGHRILSGAPAGSEWWPQTIWRDELIRFQPPGGQPTDLPRIDVGEIVAVSLTSGATRVLAGTENISLIESALPPAGDGLYWRQVAPDLLQRIMQLDLASGAVQAVFEQPQIVADPTLPDRVVLVGCATDHVFLRRYRQTNEPIGGGSHSQFVTHETGFFEHRGVDGSARQLLPYDYRFGLTGTTGTPPLDAQLCGDRVVWRDPVVGDFAVMNLIDDRTCRVDPFEAGP